MMPLLVAAGLCGLAIAGVIYESVSRRRDSVQYPPIGRLVDIGGRRLHVFVKGTEGPTVVIEQGVGGPSLAWLNVQEEIAKFARVCIYDRAGYQWSEAVRGERDLKDRVEDLRRLLGAAQIAGPYVLVAHSYGGFLVRLFAREFPELVAGMVLVDTPHEEGYLQRRAQEFYSKFRTMLQVMGILSRFGVPRLFVKSNNINSGMVRREYFAAASDDVASITRARDWMLRPDGLGGLRDLPLAVISHGQPFPGPFAVLEKDWLEGQKRLTALSKNGSLVVAENANHMIHIDSPEILVGAVRQVVTSARLQGCKIA